MPKISALPVGTTPTGVELLPADQGNTTVSLTVAQIAGLAGISVKEFGAVGDGVTDDTAALTNWLASLSTGTVGVIPAGTYLFTSALSKASGDKFAIVGAGAYQSVLLYAGASTTADLLTIGNGTGGRGGITLSNFKIDSTTTMTSGNALHLRRLARCFIDNVVVSGQDGNHLLWDGIFFNGADTVTLSGFDIETLNDGLKVCGATTKADLFISNGKITHCGRCGILIGGDFGGFYIDAADIIGNTSHGVRIDTSLNVTGNRELFFGPGCFIDSNGGAGVYFDNGLKGDSYVSFSGTWISSNTTHGIAVSSTETATSRIQVVGGTIYNNTNDGINIASTGPAVCVNGALIRNNGGWGINNAGAGTNARVGLNYFISNTSGRVTGTNYITVENGNFGIGAIPGGDRALTVGSNATGATTTYGTRNIQTVQSDVTSSFSSFSSNPATLAAAFTLTDLQHFYATQGTVGAGSAVTNQYGFRVGSSLTGATNNYGFRSDITSGTNRWNFFASGTADNYFAGNALFGNTTAIAMSDASGSALTPSVQVQGAAAAASSLTAARWAASTAPPRFILGKSRGAVATHTIVQSGDGLGEIVWVGSDGTDFAPAAQIRVEVDGAPGNNDMPGRLKFATTADGDNAVTDRLILDSTGILKPATNDGVALGTTALSYSDLFLASGGVINWNAGDVTITHSSNLLAFAGASSGYSFDSSIILSGSSSGSVTIAVPATAGSNTLTLPAGTTDFSATGGTSKVVKQTTAGGAFTVATVAASEIASGAALTKTDDTNVTLTLGGAPTTALLSASSITAGWTGTLALSRLAQGADGQLIVGQTSASPLYKSITGDWTLSAAGAATLATVNSNVGTFGSATKASVVTVNGKGLVTAASESTVTPAVGSITGLGTGVATFLATPSSANLAAALTDETGSGANVFATSPTLVTPLLGTPTSGVLTNCTGLPTAGLVDDAVTYAKIQNISATSRVLGRITAGAGDTEELTGANVATIIGGFSTQAQAETGTDNTTIMTPLRVAESIVSLDQKFKNVVGRNGGMEVWQRLVNAGTTIAVAASTVAYTVDGWYLATAANQASTITQVAGLTSNSRYAARVQRNSGQTGTGAMVFAFPLDIDELLKLNGKTGVLSFWVSTGANWSPTSGTLTWKLYCGTGAVAKRNATGYTSETNPISGSVNLATGASAALQVSAISSAIGSAITQAELQFTWTPTGTASTNDWFSIDDVQLEVCLDGVAPVTPLFERSDYVWDLMRCQRFLPVFNAQAATGNIAFGNAYANNASYHIIGFHVPTRVVTTGAIVSSAAHFQSTNGAGVGTTASVVNWGVSTLSQGQINVGVAGTPFTVGQGSALSYGSAAGQIQFTGAEI